MQLYQAEPVTPTAVPFKSQTTRQKVLAIMPWVIFGVVCVLLVVGLIVHYTDGLDDDMASELILSKMLSEGKGFIITNQWYYPTDKVFMIFTQEETTRYTIPQKLATTDAPVFYADADYLVYTFANMDELKGLLGEVTT